MSSRQQSQSKSEITIHTLPPPGRDSTLNISMRDQIESGLRGSEHIQYPGETEEDKAWGYKRSVPTLVLYDEEGLRLYDDITSYAPEYYPFEDELHLLKEHGEEIARSMGFPGKSNKKSFKSKSEENENKEQREKEHEKEDDIEIEIEDENIRVPEKPWKPARWGDADVGKYNGGVNGEEGLGGGWEKGWDVVELGAGALRKTAHLLLALSNSLPSPPINPTLDADSLPAPIRYHPLDLSKPELHRVLGEMQDSFGDQLKGKVSCVGLHGDYDAGLELIRQGKLPSLAVQQQQQQQSVNEVKNQVLGLEQVMNGSETSSSDGDGYVKEQNQNSSENVQIPTRKNTVENDGADYSPLMSADSVNIVTPKSEISALPSGITDSDQSLSCSTNTTNNSGTWSPISSNDSESNEIDSNRQRINSTTNLNPSQAKNNTIENGHESEHELDEAFTHSTKSGNEKSNRPLHMVFLGSSLGNFDRESAIPFLKSLPLKHGDTLLLGLDGRPESNLQGKTKVEIAYNDPKGFTKKFEEHGWDVVKEQLGLDEHDHKVEFVGRYNQVLGRHEAYFRSLEKQTIHLPNSNEDIVLEQGELLNIEWSYKFSVAEALELFTGSDLRVINSWKAPNSEYRLWLLERPEVIFTPPKMALETVENDSIVERTKGVPKWDDWLELWKFWDHITLQMIPKEMLHKKPIDLRHICLFYLGHIPTFLDIHLTRMIKGSHTEPEYFKTIFERGIDPDVDDPTKCHDHSEVPMSEEDWPALPEILSFRDRVRLRLQGIYESISNGQMKFTRHTGRVLFMTYEHEAMHAETLLYMLAQSELTRPPTAVSTPRWDTLSSQWNENQNIQKNKVITLEGGEIEIGHDDLEEEDERYSDEKGWENHEFGWDNEHAKNKKYVKSFKIDSLPISNSDYLTYLQTSNSDSNKFENLTTESAPASWIQHDGDGEWKIRSLYGPLDFEVAGKWPLMASKLEIEEYVKWKGGRLPTEDELRYLYQSPKGPKSAGEGVNTGVKNWHPIPPTNTYEDNAGKLIYGHNGGIWEWTNTPFEGLKGFVPSVLYPGYSKDFFDGKHYVVLGGSFVTIPSIASRKSFRNWYQANYRFSFIGGRVAYDL
ncbi:uncharacterized protein IL334_001604 [Kwoniella shivajii]|uniref:Sulfatase-modifying factor enzyme domain-containing protein n=1 Tax=Kwoniella shivajii TaxID=564305 RepID=A0ABZ1CTY3_9TREE|nr:hypothetical protein IL334_001604 [Kwoniella shivajii]